MRLVFLFCFHKISRLWYECIFQVGNYSSENEGCLIFSQAKLSLSVSSFPEFAFSLTHTYVHLLSFVFYPNHTHTNILTLSLSFSIMKICSFAFSITKPYTHSLSLSLSLSLVHPLSFTFFHFLAIYFSWIHAHTLHMVFLLFTLTHP